MHKEKVILPTTIWIGVSLLCSLKTSSLNEVPPVETITFTFKYFPNSFATELTYKASSLVGTRISA